MPNPITKTMTGVRVAVKHPRARTITGAILATIAVLVILSEIGLHIYSAIAHTTYEMNHIALLSGAIVGFVGFYLIDSRGATAATGVVVGSAVQIIRTVRGGRRSTDAPVVVPDRPAVDLPAVVPPVNPTVVIPAVPNRISEKGDE